MEKLGNFCLVDGKVDGHRVLRHARGARPACTPDGRLKFSAGSIAIHVISRAFVERLTAGGRLRAAAAPRRQEGPLRRRRRPAVKPDEPNAVKLEMFVFDALPLADADGDPGDQARPRSSARSRTPPAPTARPRACTTRSAGRRAGWRRPGSTVPRDADGQVAAAIEISPLFADSAEELAKQRGPQPGHHARPEGLPRLARPDRRASLDGRPIEPQSHEGTKGD